jgi:hypothetical protein
MHAPAFTRLFRWWCGVSLCLLFPGIAFSQEAKPVDEILKLHGMELFDAAGKTAYLNGTTKLELPDLFRLLDRLSQESSAVLQEKESYRSYTPVKCVYAAACRKVDAKSLPMLIDVYEHFPETIRMNSEMVVPIGTALARKEIAKIAEEIPSPLLLPPPLALSNSEKHFSFSKEVSTARDTYAAASQAYDHAFGISPRQGEAQENTRQSAAWPGNKKSYFLKKEIYAQLILSVLRHEKGQVNNENPWLTIAAFDEGGGCCRSADDAFDASQAMTIWLALLQERRFPLAVGAAFRLNRSEPALEEPTSVKFLKACRLDWEQLFIGALADEMVNADINRKTYAPTRRLPCHYDEILLKTLGLYGSEKSVPALMELSCLAPDARLYWQTLAQFVRPSPEAKGLTEWINYGFLPERTLPPASEVCQQQILEFFLKKAAEPNLPLTDLRWLLTTLHPLRRTETKPLMQAMLKHTSSDIAEIAWHALREMGETVPNPAPKK